MPDKWEYPWFAAWDLAFHTIPLALVDVGFAKQQIDAAAPPALPAPERAAAGVRVELHRRQPAGARLGSVLRLPAGEGAHRQRRPGLAGGRVPEAGDELHLVGQPQGPRGTQRVPGRLPRPGQHRRVRPERAAADRRSPRPGRRNRLDGPVRQSDAHDRARAVQPWRRRVPGAGRDLLRALRLDRGGDEPPRLAPGRPVGRGGRLLLRRAAAAGRRGRAAQGSLDGRAAAARGRHRDRRRRGRAVPEPRRRRAGVRRPASRRSWRASPAAAAAGPERAGACSRCSARTGCGGCWPGCSTRPSSSSPHGIRSRVPLPRRPPVHVRRRRPGLPGVLPAGGVRHGHVRRQLQLARAGVVPGERPADPGPAQPVRLLRRRVHRRVPDRVGPADDALPRSPRRSRTG